MERHSSKKSKAKKKQSAKKEERGATGKGGTLVGAGQKEDLPSERCRGKRGEVATTLNFSGRDEVGQGGGERIDR